MGDREGAIRTGLLRPFMMEMHDDRINIHTPSAFHKRLLSIWLKLLPLHMGARPSKQPFPDRILCIRVLKSLRGERGVIFIVALLLSSGDIKRNTEHPANSYGCATLAKQVDQSSMSQMPRSAATIVRFYYTVSDRVLLSRKVLFFPGSPPGSLRVVSMQDRRSILFVCQN